MDSGRPISSSTNPAQNAHHVSRSGLLLAWLWGWAPMWSVSGRNYFAWHGRKFLMTTRAQRIPGLHCGFTSRASAELPLRWMSLKRTVLGLKLQSPPNRKLARHLFLVFGGNLKTWLPSTSSATRIGNLWDTWESAWTHRQCHCNSFLDSLRIPNMHYILSSGIGVFFFCAVCNVSKVGWLGRYIIIIIIQITTGSSHGFDSIRTDINGQMFLLWGEEEEEFAIPV